ncbi:MAG: hypothetical protein WDW38_010661 [Sanguina aurantia]
MEPDSANPHSSAKGGIEGVSITACCWCAGPSAATCEQQLRACTSQLETLLAALQRAMESISHLSLAIEDSPEPGSYHVEPAAVSDGVPITVEVRVPVPEEVAAMANSVLAQLARAAPLLKRLHLSGCVSHTALKALSAAFPRLTGVEVEALSVPIRTVQFLLPRLPKLSHFALTSQLLDQSPDGQEVLQAYVSASFLALHSRLQLARVDLALAAGTLLHVSDGAWEALPRSLQELQCTHRVAFHTLGHLESLQRVRRLAVPDLPFSSLSELSGLFPNLERLTLPGPRELLIECCYDRGHNDIRHLRAVFDRGLKLVTPSLRLEGKSSFIKDMLSVMPPLPATTSLTLGLQGTRPYTFCLEHIARVFPRLRCLTIMGEGSLSGASPMTDKAFVAPLLKCAALERLQLSVQISLTTETLEQLCTHLPRLSFLFFYPWEGVDKDQLKAKAQGTRPEFELMPYTCHGYFAHPEAVASMYNQ